LPSHASAFFWPRLRPDLLLTVLALTLLPLALHKANFPFRLSWISLIVLYLIIAAQAVLAAGILWAIECPGMLANMARRYWRKKSHIVVFAVFLGFLIWLSGLWVALPAGVLASGITELRQQSRPPRHLWSGLVRPLLVAAMYLFFGILLAWIYTSVTVRLHFYGAYDAFFNQLDHILFATSVSGVVHRAFNVLPAWMFVIFNKTYYLMFPQVGATLVICGLAIGPKRAMQFVGAVLLAFYLSVIIFFFWPSHGPYYLCTDHWQHTAVLIHSVSSYAAQQEFLAKVKYLWAGSAVSEIPLGHYIAFPSLHFALPLIVLWFLRPWRRIVIVLAVYDVFLAVAIILLEWHYFVDLIGGIGVAAVAIALAEVPRRRAPGQSGSDETFSLEFPNTGGTL
jgi:hypothetical protein